MWGLLYAGAVVCVVAGALFGILVFESRRELRDATMADEWHSKPVVVEGSKFYDWELHGECGNLLEDEIVSNRVRDMLDRPLELD
jgi:hypothetical protein